MRGQALAWPSLLGFIILFASLPAILPLLQEVVNQFNTNVNSPVANFFANMLIPVIILSAVGSVLIFASAWARGQS